MKKFLSMVLCLIMALSLCSVAGAEAAYAGEIKVWVADNAVELTKTLIEQFKTEHPEYAGITALVEAVGEGDAANKMIVDVDAGADIFGFAQDQLTRLVAAGALIDMLPENAAIVAAENDAGAVAAATVGEVVYAYPITSDNGYFLYYDKSVVTDTTTLEAVLAACESAGKNLYFQINSGWYNASFFFGAGCTLTYDTNDQGQYTAINTDYDTNPAAVTALKSMIKMAKSPAYVNGSSVPNATNIGAVVSGAWDADAAQTALGENYAATKLPTVDGYQLGGFGGFKLLGVKPQTDEAKLTACDALALYLSSEKAQIARFEEKALQWGPSNLKAQSSDAVKNNIALSALAQQLNFAVPQGQYPGCYWSATEALGDQILSGMYNEYTDDQLKQVLVDLVKSCSADVIQ
ncbi:MAG: extracellular solute-binding protein [Clostridia bacterium]|nr:extracellular solute-binding protein [Clostridia bacterium]